MREYALSAHGFRADGSVKGQAVYTGQYADDESAIRGLEQHLGFITECYGRIKYYIVDGSRLVKKGEV